MKNLSKTKVILYLAAIFLAGGISGAVIILGASKPKPPPHEGFRPPNMRDACDHMKVRLQSKLNLTAGQMEKILPILEQRSRDMEAIHGATMQQIEALIRKSNAEIAKELTPEQRVKLEEMENKRRQFLQNHPPPGQ